MAYRWQPPRSNVRRLTSKGATTATPPRTRSSSQDQRLRYWVFGGVICAVGAGIVYLVLMVLRPSVIHFYSDDISLSAVDFVDEREAHCQASAALYRRGDRRIAVPFADAPEEVNDQEITNTFLFNPCDNLLPSTQVGQQGGTSVILLLEWIAQETQRLRQQAPQQRVVVTITLDHNEVVGDQPALDDAGSARLQAAANVIAAEGQGAIAIIGPGGSLQGWLKQAFHELPAAEVCAFAATETCVRRAFDRVR